MKNNTKAIKEKILSLNGEKVAIGFKATPRERSFQAWGVCYAKNRPAFTAYLKSFKGAIYAIAPENVEFIAKMKCEIGEIDY